MLVTVAICCYNHAEYIERAINSVLEQTYKKIQLIIINDGSTDNSREIIDRYSKFALVFHKTNEGQIAGYNLAIKNATGRYIFFLDADDFYYPHCVDKVIKSMLLNRSVKAHFRLDCVNEEGELIGRSVPNKISDGNVSEKLKKGWLYYSSPGSGNCYDLDVLKKLYPIPLSSKDKHGADFFCIYGCALYGLVSGIDEVLGAYRVLIKRGALNSVSFGNASLGAVEPERQENREQRLLSWIRYLGFQEKIEYLYSIPTVKLKISSVMVGSLNPLFDYRYRKYLRHLVRAVVFDASRGLLDRVLILLWGSCVVFLPRKARFWLVKKACNPLSR